MRKIRNKNELTMITVRIENEILAILDEESKKLMRGRSNLVRVIMNRWADEVKRERQKERQHRSASAE